jgi:hypothetical protein
MFFSDEFIEKVEMNPIIGIVDVCNKIQQQIDENNHQGWTDEEHQFLWETCSFIQLVIEEHGMSSGIDFPIATSQIDSNCTALYGFVANIKSQLESDALKMRVEEYKNRYKGKLKKSFSYEFSQGDLDKIKDLIKELMELIADNQHLEDDHRKRLLKRLEILESEISKRVSDLDRFWGLIGDAGVVVSKLGPDAKPIVDRIKEMAEISWKTQSRAEELPSNTRIPMLDY